MILKACGCRDLKLPLCSVQLGARVPARRWGTATRTMKLTKWWSTESSRLSQVGVDSSLLAAAAAPWSKTADSRRVVLSDPEK